MQGLYSYIEEYASKNPQKKAIVFYDEIIKYKDISDFANKVRIWHSLEIKKLGALERKPMAFIFLPQSAQAIMWFFGLMSAGVTPAFMPLPSHKQDENKYWDSHRQLLELTEPTLIITTDEWVDSFKSITQCHVYNNQVLEDSVVIDHYCDSVNSNPAFLQHSSGTTGLKKGVALSHEAVVKQIQSYSKALNSSINDVVVSWLPMYHDMGLIACTIMPLVLGQTIVLLDPFKWVSKPISLFQAIDKNKGTLVWLPNFAFEHLRRTIRHSKFEDLDISSIKALINCSEPCKAQTFDRFVGHFSELDITLEKLQVCYAMAETVYAVSQTKLANSVDRIWVDEDALLDNKLEVVGFGHDKARELLSCGSIIDGCEVNILHPETQNKVEANEIGEIVISGDFLFDGYYKRPDKTEAVFDGVFYRTRDLGFIYNKQLYVLGRKDDLIISNGRNYFAHEIEQHINDLPSVKAGRNVALGLYNDTIGSNEVYVIQELGIGQELDEVNKKEFVRLIKKTVQDNIGLVLKEVIIVEPSWLHKSSSGKISRELNKRKLMSILNQE